MRIEKFPTLVLPLFLLLSAAPLLAGEGGTSTKDRASVAWEKIAAGAFLVDVRTPQEFAQGHLEGATNIPLSEVEKRLDAFGRDRERPIVLYCRTGRRSGIALGILEKHGFKNLFNGGGFEELRNAKPRKK